MRLGNISRPFHWRFLHRTLLPLLMTMIAAAPLWAEELTAFSFGGNAGWVSDGAVSHDGISSMRSGGINNGETSWMETSVTGPGVVRFWWKVSSEGCCDPLSFMLDGVSLDNIRGEQGWQSKAYSVPAGSHTLRWSYSTDGSVLTGANAGWVDEVSYTPGSDEDIVPPSTNAAPTQGAYASLPEVTLSCSDNVSCTGTFYCLGTDCTPTTPYSAAIALPSATTVRFYSTDAAGNSEAVRSALYSVDNSAPSTSASYPAGTYGPIQLFLYCSDVGAGCGNTYFCLGADCTPSTLYSPGCIYGPGTSCPPGSTYPILVSSSTAVRFYSRDLAGNSEEVKTVSYTIDQTPPATTATPAGGTYDAAPAVTLSCSDSGTGCQSTYYCKGENCTPTTFYDHPVRITDATVLRFFSRDQGGNAESVVTISYGKPAAKTRNVPAGYATIQGAIDASYSGDTILVAPGSYRENINFNGKNLTLRSEGGAQGTTIYGDGSAAVVTFASAEGPGAVLDGFAITNGNSSNGGGVYISEASPTLINNRIFGNNGSWGGAISVSNGSPSIRNNVITGNKAGMYGGGINLMWSSGEIIGNTIAENSGDYGGGISTWGAGTPTIRENTISRNEAYYGGGGISLVNGTDALIVGNLIAENISRNGSAINWTVPADTRGAYLVNNTIVSSDDSTASVVHAEGYDSQALFVNNIISAQGSRTAVYCGTSTGTSNPPRFSHNAVYSRNGAAFGGECSDQNGVDGNITADPLLAAPALGHYALRSGSPAIDAGVDAAQYVAQGDLDGKLRVRDGNGDGTAVIDLGAYELDPALPVAGLQGVPTASLATDTLTLTVTGVTTYRYSLDGGPFSGDTASATPITLAGLANGSHSIVVLGKNAAGIEQALSAATGASWMVDTEIPPFAISFGGDLPWFIQSKVSRDGLAYQSGALGTSQTSWMEGTVTGPGVVRFWWRSSTYDYGNSLIFSIDGTTQEQLRGLSDWLPVTVAVPAGSHRLRWSYATGSYLYGEGIAFWVDQIGFQQGTDLDLTPPATSATPGAGIYPSTQSVTLACADNTGCGGTWYCLGEGCDPRTPYSSPIAVSADGPRVLRFYSSDLAGNSEGINTFNYSFDTAAPTTYNSLSGGTYVGGREAPLVCLDGGMGCATTYYCLGSGCTPSTPYSGAIAITASTDLRYYSVDSGGNTEQVQTVSYTILPDLAAPTTSPSEPAGTYQRLYSFALDCNDAGGSGCAATYYCKGEGCTPTTPFHYGGGLDILSSTVLRFYSVDRSGNSEAVKSVSYSIDADLPRTTPSTAGGIHSSPQTISLACSDGSGSGCRQTYYCLGKACSPTQIYQSAISVSSSQYLSYYSMDMAGNREPVRSERYTILTAPPTTINVPADSSTIQGAIDLANDGDTVLVAAGTYPENIDFRGKAITVRSSGGAAVTIIDGKQAGPVASFVSGEWRSSVLDGFTIRNGRYPQTSYPDENGGGIVINGAAPVIRNNSIVDNVGCYGVGVYVNTGYPLIERNLIAHNSQGSCSLYGGGGVVISSAPGTEVVGNTIRDNRVTYGSGGGIQATNSSTLSIRGNTILNNSCSGQGGGIALLNQGEAEIAGNLVAGNSAESGGALYLSPYVSNGRIAITNNTMAGNHATQADGAYFFGYGGEAIALANNIIDADSGAVHCDEVGAHPPELSHNLVFARTGSAYSGSCSAPDDSMGNLTGDPLFAAAQYGYYGLRTGSPAIDAGDNGAAAIPATDLGGAPRIVVGRLRYQIPEGAPQSQTAVVDLGAFEFDPTGRRATLSAPPATTTDSSASFTVGGDGIGTYRYALDGAPFTTADTPVTEPIRLTGLSGGTHALAVIGKWSSGQQPEDSPTIASWSVDVTAPVTTPTPGSGSYTAPQNVTLACDDGTGSGCSGTFYCLGPYCTPSTPYSGPIAVTGSTGLRFYSVDAFGFRESVKSATYNFTGTISGRISDAGTGNGVGRGTVTVYSAATGNLVTSAYTDEGGNYQISGLGSGYYKLSYWATGYLPQWYNGKNDRSSGDSVHLVAPGNLEGVDVAMVRGGTISGTVSAGDSGAALSGVGVSAYSAATGTPAAYSSTDSQGAYSLSGLSPGDYKLSFTPYNMESGYLARWYDGKADMASANTVSITAGAATMTLNVVLQQGGSISGKVSDPGGTALAGVTVVAVDPATGIWLRNGTTDASGGYQLTGLGGSYKIYFSGYDVVSTWYGGSSLESATTLSVAPKSATTGINVVMTKSGSFSGTVTESGTGAGVAGAYISVTDAKGITLGSSSSDSSGAYSVSGLPTGKYRVRFSAAGYLPQWWNGQSEEASAVELTVTAPNATTAIDAALVKGGAITGRVTDRTTGDPLGGSISVYDAQSGEWRGSGSCDDQGVYRIDGLASGSYKIQVNFYSGYGSTWYGGTYRGNATAVQVTAPGVVTGIDLSVEQSGSITGTVTDAGTGDPINEASVTAFNTLTGEYEYAYTDASGSYSISTLGTGGYQVSFYKYGYLQKWSGGDSQESAAVVAVSAPETTAGIDAAMVKAGSISGTIADKNTGAGISGAYVYAIDRASGAWAGSSSTDLDGSYTIPGLATGSYLLKVMSGQASAYLGKRYGDNDSFICGETVSVTAPDATTGVDMLLQEGGTISGRVTDAATGAGVPSVSVYWTTGSNQTVMGNLRVDQDGSYTIGGLPSGDYLVYFSATNYLRGAEPVRATVSAPAVTSGIDATLAKGGAISGHVTDSRTQAGFDNIEVIATGSNGLTEMTWVDYYSGSYLIGGLPSGTYTVSVRGTGGEVVSDGGTGTSETTRTLTVAAPATTTDVDFTIVRHQGAISGTVTDAVDGSPIAQLMVVVYDPITQGTVASVSTSSDGYYLVTVPVGSYRIRFDGGVSGAHSRGGYLTNWYHAGAGDASTVTVVEDQTAGGIDAQMARGGGIAGVISIDACPAPRSVTAKLYDATTNTFVLSTRISTDYTDRFQFNGLAPGSYKLEIEPDENGFLRQWFSNKKDAGSANVITVGAGAVVDAPVTVSHGGGSISGRITADGCVFTGGIVSLYDYYSGAFVSETDLFSQNYAISGVADGTYKLFYRANLGGRWYRSGDATAASPVVVAGGVAVTGIDTSACGLGPVGPLKGGDCDGDGTVSIAEVQLGINMFLGMKLVAACVDTDHDGAVSISEVQKTINNFLGL